MVVEDVLQKEMAAPIERDVMPQQVRAISPGGCALENVGVRFSFEVELSGQDLGTLTFGLNESAETVCKDFVTTHHLREIFQAPLVTFLELMVHMDKRSGKVDVVDLL